MSLTLALGKVTVPVGVQLFLPETRMDDAHRCMQAGVSEAAMMPRIKGELAPAGLDPSVAAGVRSGTVPADTEYGANAEFGHGLDARDVTEPN